MHELLRSNLNFFWGGVIAETLSQCGIKHVIISPGSRSAPLTTGFALNEKIKTTPVLDERSAAFYALGLAKASGLPVALICTSGTAAANYLPAVIEARYARVPLIILTADRPPELRDCAAGQAIDQQKLFGDYIHWYHELALPNRALLPYMQKSLQQAWRKSLGCGGPVHLNIPFRDPLAPVVDGETWELSDDAIRAVHKETFSKRNVDLDSILADQSSVSRGLVIAGPDISTAPKKYARGVLNLAKALGWPILADTLSPMRHHGRMDEWVIAHYDCVLRDLELSDTLKPSAVIQIGPLPTCKVLRKWLSDLNVPTSIISLSLDNLDPLHRPANYIQASPNDFATHEVEPKRSDFLEIWLNENRKVAERFESAFGACDELFEGKISWLLEKHLPENTPVFVASSMPVRDVEFFWPANDKHFRFAANRGANGIDGTLSSAMGYVEGCGQPGVLLTGDLAFLHDQNGLLMAPEFEGSLTVIVINNNGGGIFEKLEISKFDPPFEQYFATPQNVDLAQISASHNLRHSAPTNWDAFISEIKSLPESGIRIIELKTNRKEDMAFRQKLFKK
ncbi:2-succinyl-5-enolpyruvyl-6-hydroxy-3-cyclohexene-1-carboxylic-acid synthase [Rubellicoccus peritrichatus]|uniref:2-succinyl-5-enolpyruvyl-6-hydroxy-3-cyclohexene-1-carboxylate synthase n=1 Tax=Rubellicoccus peritrichatus TaxID=3080537 RepID=A0AAQ3QS90_9BACT|nr:2-succinyl-5-enolpyruvyl-6-hydroxy-3-cyclohexene-1-carboxylic-acid synthase [Puniceicoccus sp. CR14]WOO40111.1 2-succinyl-5-enolpyruvyl-6-hydroxy-3-cyclohexene-1-carboxylic-acid synthase [Puniceicoccus sp. CR14]